MSVSHIAVLLGGRPLDVHDPDAVRRAIEEWNRGPNRGRSALPDRLNPRCLSADEVLAFVEALPRLPEATLRALRDAPLELSAPALKLAPVDGFGVHGFTEGFGLVRDELGWSVRPEVARADVQVELDDALAWLEDREADVASAAREVDATPREDPHWPARWRALASAREGLALAQSVALGLVEKAAVLAEAGERPRAAGRVWTAAALAEKKRALEAALGSAPPVGGMP